MKITKNFSYWEFGPKGCSKSWIPDNAYQRILISNLAENLQKLRDEAKIVAGHTVSIHITSGVRTIADYYRLQGAGYHPSPTSDHFCGLAIPIVESSPKRKKFGETYNFSVGASDCVAKGMRQIDFFKLAMRCHRESKAHFGQVIYEKHKNSEWVHLSNPYEEYFSHWMIDWLGRKPFLKSIDGGKNYKVATA